MKLESQIKDCDSPQRLANDSGFCFLSIPGRIVPSWKSKAWNLPGVSTLIC